MKKPRPSLEHDTLPARYVSILLDVCAEWGVTKEQLLAHSPLAALDLNAADTRISFTELNWFVARALKLTQQPSIGINAAAALKLSTHGFFGFAILTSATIADAVDLLEKFMFLQSGPFYIESSIEVEMQLLNLNCHELPPTNLDAIYAEAILLTIVYVALDLLDEPDIHFEIHIKAPTPDYYAAIAASLPCPIRYSQCENQLRFPVHYLNKKLKQANAASFQLAKTQCEQNLQELTTLDPLKNRVKALLSADLLLPPDLVTLAGHCHLSTRSLKRKLAEQGTSYNQLLEEIRKEAALLLLSEQKLSVKEVAQRLGFSSTTNFSRAFKKWTGHTPRHYFRQ